MTSTKWRNFCWVDRLVDSQAPRPSHLGSSSTDSGALSPSGPSVDSAAKRRRCSSSSGVFQPAIIQLKHRTKWKSTFCCEFNLMTFCLQRRLALNGSILWAVASESKKIMSTPMEQNEDFKQHESLYPSPHGFTHTINTVD